MGSVINLIFFQTGVLQEKVPDGNTVGISIHGLTKFFNKKKVVDNLNANIYGGQVTALLGHNGAAKTTTMYVTF